MEAIIFVGIQGSGKSTFYTERFFRTHVRINLDMLRTRRRENILLKACFDTRQRFVVDNTNPTRGAREKYLAAAQTAGFRTIAYFFDVSPEDALPRNEQRQGRQRVPDKAIHATHRKLERPTREEGFDEIYRVQVGPDGYFQVQLVESTSASSGQEQSGEEECSST